MLVKHWNKSSLFKGKRTGTRKKETSLFQSKELAGNTWNTKLKQLKTSVAYCKGLRISVVINTLPRLLREIKSNAPPLCWMFLKSYKWKTDFDPEISEPLTGAKLEFSDHDTKCASPFYLRQACMNRKHVLLVAKSHQKKSLRCTSEKFTIIAAVHMLKWKMGGIE